MLQQGIKIAAFTVVCSIVAGCPTIMSFITELKRMKKFGRLDLKSMHAPEAVSTGFMTGLVFRLAAIKHMYVGFLAFYILAVHGLA